MTIAANATPWEYPATADRWAGYVSVVVPVYNELAHLEELLKAVLASPVKKEIIIIDDGSTDGTREKLESMPPSEIPPEPFAVSRLSQH
jgi:glycosyltransferase involved in cell wall biosynthesis